MHTHTPPVQTFGKIIYSNGIIDEGNWENGLRSGRSIRIYPDSEEKLIGNYKTGILQEGEGCYKYKNGTISYGKYINNQLNGNGKVITNNNNIYEGNYINGF